MKLHFLVAEIATLWQKEILRNPTWMSPNTSCRYFWDHPIRLYCLLPRLKPYIHHKFSAHALSELIESVPQVVAEKYGTTLSSLHVIRYSGEYLNSAFLCRWSFLGGPVVWLARISEINASRFIFFGNFFVERKFYGVMWQFFLLDAVLDKYGMTALSSRSTVRKMHDPYFRPAETVHNCFSWNQTHNRWIRIVLLSV